MLLKDHVLRNSISRKYNEKKIKQRKEAKITAILKIPVL